MKTLKLPATLTLLRQYNFPKKLGILERLYGKQLSKYGVHWVECANGMHWKLDLSDACHRWLVFGQYEGGKGINYATSILKNGGVYIDSGANIGQWLLYLSSIPNLRTLAFEPVESEWKWLRECLNQHPDWDTELIQCGLGSKKAEAEIQVYGSKSTLNMDWYLDKKLEKTSIKIQPLDEFLFEKKITRVDFWKLDVEGAELEALKGAERFLKTQQIKHIYFECHPSNYRKTIEFLDLFNYKVCDLHEDHLSPKTEPEISTTQDLVAIPIG